jgi:hypothetical protein
METAQLNKLHKQPLFSIYNLPIPWRELISRPIEPNSTQGCQMAYFQTKKSQFGLILEGLAKEDVGKF